MKTAFFCHGMPGSVADAGLLTPMNPGTEITALNLLHHEPVDACQALFDVLPPEAVGTGEGGVHLVGFSIGAMVAIRIAASWPDLVSKLTLVSPAAPLQLGEFLPIMAGKPIFSLAMENPRLLSILTGVQGAVTRFSPDLMIRLLFARCGSSEQALLKNPAIRKAICDGLLESLVMQRRIYLAYVKAYVTDWSDSLAKLQCPVALWHGTADTWSPLQMSAALKRELGGKCILHPVEGAEHYSTLSHVQL